MRLRLLSAVAALGLLAGHVRGQYRDAFEALDDELAPRSWPTGLARPAVLEKRDGSCGDGSHPCSDVNSTSCCSNDSFCIVNTDWNVQCCALGFDCSEETPCDTARYYGNATTTTTLTDSASLTSTSLVTVLSACVGRTCTGAFYGCPSSLGGACCAFGSQCGTTDGGGGICLATETPSPTTTATSSNNTSTTMSTTTSTNPPALPTGATVSHLAKGLSAGAKAGIAVSVVILAALLLAALTYLCVRRRRSSRSAATTTTAQELPSMTAAARGAAFSDNGIRPYDAASGPHMSEADGYSYGYAPSSTQASRAEGRTSNGAAGDYFGLGVAPGQDDDDGVVEIGTATVGRRRRPQHVRTGSVPGPAGGHRGGSETGGSELADTSASSTRGGGGGGPASPVDTIAERFELYGDYYGSGATPASGGHDEVFHDAQESFGRHGGSGPSSVLPQPFPTPGSEMSEFGTPSPVSREEAHPRRAV